MRSRCDLTHSHVSALTHYVRAQILPNIQFKKQTKKPHHTAKMRLRRSGSRVWSQLLLGSRKKKVEKTAEQGVQGKEAHPMFSHILSVYSFYPPANQQTPTEGGMDTTSLFFLSFYTSN